MDGPGEAGAREVLQESGRDAAAGERCSCLPVGTSFTDYPKQPSVKGQGDTHTSNTYGASTLRMRQFVHICERATFKTSK